MEIGEKPRKLTEDEIQDILKVIPDIKSAADTVSKRNTKSMKELLREQLQEIEITPLGISDLKQEMVRQFEESLIRSGSMVGVTSGEAISKPITQMALNSFHSSGSAKNVSVGVSRITELVNATKEPKKPSSTVYFKDQGLSFDEIIIKARPIFTEMTVKDLVIGLPDVDNVSSIVEPYWYDYYRTLVRNDFKAKDVLRLTLDVNLLYAYKITMQDIVNSIERGQPVICVYSPMSEGKIDIYPIEKTIISKLTEMKINIVDVESASQIFLLMIVIPALDKLKISGVSGIKQIYPVETPVWQIVKEEIKTNDFKDENGWYLVLNTIRMKVTGITVDKLVKLCEIANIKVLKVRDYYIAVSSIESPTKVVLNLIAKDKEVEKAYEKEKKANPNVARRPPSEISIHSKLIYADTTGSNLRELLSNPEIDSTRTFSNNVHEIHQMFGIEAARTFLIKEFIDVIVNEGYINPRHIVLLVDFMCSLGRVNGLTSTGVSRQPIGALEKSSFEKAMKYFKEAVVFGEENPISAISASIFVGKKALVGTGYSDEYINPRNLERYDETRAELMGNPNMTLDITSFNEAIEKFDIGPQIDIQRDVSFLAAAEEEMFGTIEPQRSEPGKVTEDLKLQEPVAMIKGKVIRSAELEEIAGTLSDAPCLRPPRKEQEVVTTIENPSIQKIIGIPQVSIKLPPPMKFVPPKAKPVAKFNIEEFLE